MSPDPLKRLPRPSTRIGGFAFGRTCDLYTIQKPPWDSTAAPTFTDVDVTFRKPWIAYIAYNQITQATGGRHFIHRFWLDPSINLPLWIRGSTDPRLKLILKVPEFQQLWYMLDWFSPYFDGDELLAWYVNGRCISVETN